MLAGIAQLVEQPPCKRQVPGSIPGASTNSRRGSVVLASLALRAVVLLLAMLGRTAYASCFAEQQGGDGAFGEQIQRDARGAIVAIQASLAAQTAAATIHTQWSRAQRFAMLLDAFEVVGDLEQAQRAYANGIAALTPADGLALRHRLELRHLALLADRGQIASALEQYERVAGGVAEDAPYRICMLIDRGYLRYRNGIIGAAAADLIRAHDLAASLNSDRWRIDAGNALSMVYSRAGFHDEAAALADEALRFYQRSGSKSMLAEAYFVRGDVSLHQDDFAAAEPDFVKARDLSDEVAQTVNAMYAQQRLCRTLVGLRRTLEARVTCADAYLRATAIGDAESAKLVLGAKGALELSMGRFRDALALLDRALAPDGLDMAKHLRAQIHRDRSLVREELGDAAGALRDKQVYVAWLDEERAARTADQMAVLRVKLETAVMDKQLAGARDAAAAARAEASRQSLLRNATVVLAMVVIAAVLLTSWLWRRRNATESARRAAEESLTAVSRLTGGIAHDFNNQLTVMQQALGLLQRRAAIHGDATATALLEEIRASSQACADVTAQMLSFARQQHLKPERVLLQRHLDNNRLLLERTGGANVAIECNIASPALAVWVDARQLTAALLNLVSNSRDAMPQGGTVAISAAADSGRIRIDVSDAGVGMSAEVAAHAVEPFFSTKQVGSGSGLGLSMVEGFVRQSGGSMKIVSELFRGTTVSLWLPPAGVAA